MTRTDLIQLFLAAGQAHHDAFVETDGANPHWPAWYSRYLALPLSHVLGTTLPPEVIAAALSLIEMEKQAGAPDAEWTEYYADWFLARYAAQVDADASTAGAKAR